jgi:hypothetical protein
LYGNALLRVEEEKSSRLSGILGVVKGGGFVVEGSTTKNCWR